MGDRANIKIIDEAEGTGATGSFFFYTHWTGSDLPEILQAALKRGEARLDDSAYLARIIFSEMIQGSVLSETGFGISTLVQDGDDRVIEVDMIKQTVKLADVVYSFKEYVALPIEKLTWYGKDEYFDEED